MAISTDKTSWLFSVLFFFLVIFFGGCGKKPTQQKTVVSNTAKETPEYVVVSDSAFYSESDSGVVMDKPQLAAFYKTDEMKEYYGKRVLPPKFDYNIDLSKKTFMELRMLKNEIFARNGYLFGDPTLRAYFNQFAWYQPIFDVPDFKLYLDKQEKEFLDKVTELENEKFAQLDTTVSGSKMVRLDHVVNLAQFENINDSLLTALQEKNFALSSANNDQLFYVYDNNEYGYIPNFITTDLYLQVLHKYLSSLTEGIEKRKLISTVTSLLRKLYDKSYVALESQGTGKSNGAVAWASTYLAIGLHTLTGNDIPVSPAMQTLYQDETKKVFEAAAYGSKFLNRTVFYYSQFKPRGYYTKDDTLQKYFKCIKWLNSAPMNVDDDNSFQAALLIAYWIMSDNDCKYELDLINRVINLFSGKEDNYSIGHLITILDNDGIKTTDQLLSPQNITKLRSQVKASDISRIQPQGANDIAKMDFSKKYILFSAGRYTFDAEILQRLINIQRPGLLRPFPKGVDVFAVLGNKSAENILLNDFKENQRWPAYSDSLYVIKSQFEHYDRWNTTLYDKMMNCINSLNVPVGKNYPLFMLTNYWQKKNLNTSLAAWTELKHDMILYTEQPYAAEAGEGGGPPPPMQWSYVEPNVIFWTKTVELLNSQYQQMSDLGLMTTELSEINSDLRKLAEFLLGISNKELAGENVTDEEFSEMNSIGGRIEGLTFQILGTDHLPEREKQIALAVDVYSFNDTVLEEAVGKADEIYAIAEINGIPHLTKGACFSYYEFQNKSRLTDEEWQEMIAEGKTPSRPKWLNDIYVKTASLRAKPGYSFETYVTHGERPGYQP